MPVHDWTRVKRVAGFPLLRLRADVRIDHATMLLSNRFARVEVLERRALMCATALPIVHPDAALHRLDLQGGAADLTPAPATAAVHGRPVARGGAYRFKVTFQSEQPIRRETLDGDDGVLVVAPDGSSRSAELLGLRSAKRGTRVVASYRIASPDAGQHRIVLSTDAAAALSLDAT